MIFQNNSEEKNNSKYNNFSYIVTPSTPSLTLSTAAIASINSSLMNNFDSMITIDNTTINKTTSVNMKHHFSFIQNGGLLSPSSSQSSLSNQRKNDSTNLIFATTASSMINSPSIYNPNPVQQQSLLTQVSQPILINNSYIDDNNMISAQTIFNGSSLHTTPVQQPVQQPIQFTTQQIQSIPSELPQVQMTYPSPLIQYTPVVPYQQPVIVNNIPFNNDIYNTNDLASDYAVSSASSTPLTNNDLQIAPIVTQSIKVFNNTGFTPLPQSNVNEISNENQELDNLLNSLPCNGCNDKDEVRHQKPRFEGDIYTPKLVRYSGNAKEGFCDQCNPGRWLQLKNSAYWYHKQFFHGISSVLGKPFHAPLSTKVIDYKELLELVNETERKNIIDSLIGNNKHSKNESSSPNDNLAVITDNEEFLKAFEKLINESSVILPENFKLSDCILKFVVGKCHHCNEWVPLMATKKRCNQLFTNILIYKQNDNIQIENNKNGKPFNKYYLKKKYNMYNDKKNITETILTYLQQVKQNKKDIDEIVNNKGMTILWYRHAHKCHQYVKPKMNKSEISSSSNNSSSSKTSSVESTNVLPSPVTSTSLSNNKRKLSSEDESSNNYEQNKRGRHM